MNGLLHERPVEALGDAVGLRRGFEGEALKEARRIFALCDPGVTQQIIERAKIGVVVPAEDVDACEKTLEGVLRKPLQATPAPDRQYLEQFDRAKISARFAALLNDMTAAVS